MIISFYVRKPIIGGTKNPYNDCNIHQFLLATIIPNEYSYTPTLPNRQPLTEGEILTHGIIHFLQITYHPITTSELVYMGWFSIQQNLCNPAVFALVDSVEPVPEQFNVAMESCGFG
jgi:hypothetical protein